MKVMHVITSLDIGGAEQMLRRLVTAKTRPDVSHSVVTMIPGGPLHAAIQGDGIPVVDLGMRPGRANLSGLWQLRRLIRRQRPDLIQTWLYHADLVATLALQLSGRRRQTRLVWGLRCSDMHAGHATPRHRMILRVLAHLSRRPDLIISNSAAGMRVHTAVGYRPRRWQVIPNGFHTELFAPDDEGRCRMRAELGLGDDDFAIVLCARVAPMKDHKTFVRAAEIVAAQLPQARFVLIGRNTDRSDTGLDRMIVDSAAADRFLRLGERRDIAAILPAMDLATLTSAFGEGFPNVLGEAMATAIPCVSSAAGDAAEVIGDTGLIVPVRDPQAMATAWLEMFSQGREGRARLGAMARDRVLDNFAMDKVFTQFIDTYSELCGTN